jgi:hypothetical protein
MVNVVKAVIPQSAFLLLFAAEFTFYLLILQTGIVEFHHSIISEIWMVPAGGIVGIILSIFLSKERHWLMPFLLIVQLLLVFDYAHENFLELFLLGLISGVTAPILISRIDRFWVVVLALALSYAYGTYTFDISATQRTSIAVLLTVIALISSFFSQIQTASKDRSYLTLYGATSIFLWLLLDASLFETLSRNSAMHLWGNEAFTWDIILSHLVGLAVAYKARDWEHNDSFTLVLFILTYTFYALGWQLALSLVYPFVISYYNVIILRQFMHLPYTILALMALSLWAASGLGLFVAISHSFVFGWVILLLLGMVYLVNRKMDVLSTKTLSNLFSLYITRSSRDV